MSRLVFENWKNVLRFLSRCFQIEGIRAKVHLIFPNKFARRSNLYLSKLAIVFPECEDPVTGQIRKINCPSSAVIKQQRNTIPIEYFHCHYLIHLLLPSYCG